MKRHTQASLGFGRGSCFSTAIACCLDLEADDVPNFVLFGNAWIEALGVWAWEKKIHISLMRDDPGGGPMPCGGPGPRFRENGERISHAVVVQDGKIAHDPHPSGAGIDLATAVDWWPVSFCALGGCKECGLRFGNGDTIIGATFWRARTCNEGTTVEMVEKSDEELLADRAKEGKP